MTYAPPTVPLSASWGGAAAYSGSNSIVYARWAGGNYITPAGKNELVFGTPFVTKQQFANHVGFDSATFSPALVARDQLPVSVAEFSTHENQRVTKLLNDAVQAALNGTKTSAQALKDAQREADRILRSYQ